MVLACVLRLKAWLRQAGNPALRAGWRLSMTAEAAKKEGIMAAHYLCDSVIA